MSLLKGNWLLKLAALCLAVPTYFYITTEIQREEKKEHVEDPSYKLIKLTSKSLPVKVRLAGAVAEGYRIVDQEVVARPANIIAIGPEALLEETESAETALVDVSDATQTLVKIIPLESVAGKHLAGNPQSVEVTIPVQAIENPS